MVFTPEKIHQHYDHHKSSQSQPHLPEMCNLILQQYVKSLFHFIEHFTLQRRHSANPVWPVQTQRDHVTNGQAHDTTSSRQTFKYLNVYVTLAQG